MKALLVCAWGEAEERKSQWCREPERGSKILCWQNHWPQYCTQILAEKKKKTTHKPSPGETERPGATHERKSIESEEIMQAHAYTEAYSLQWYLHTIMPTHAHAHKHTHTCTSLIPRPGIGWLSTLFSPKRSLYPLSSPRILICGKSRDGKIEFSALAAPRRLCKAVNTLNNKRLQVIWSVWSVFFH